MPILHEVIPLWQKGDTFYEH